MFIMASKQVDGSGRATAVQHHDHSLPDANVVVDELLAKYSSHIPSHPPSFSNRES